MKFVTNDGTIFEVSNLTHIVINNVTQIIELGEAHSDKRKNKPPDYATRRQHLQQRLGWELNHFGPPLRER